MTHEPGMSDEGAVLALELLCDYFDDPDAVDPKSISVLEFAGDLIDSVPGPLLHPELRSRLNGHSLASDSFASWRR